MTSSGEIGSDAFARARGAARAQALQERLVTRRTALAALHAARDAFAEAAAEGYGAGSAAALADADAIEDLAGRLHAFVQGLEPLLDALDLARDQTVHRGPLLARRRSLLDPIRLATLVGEALADELLSEPAAALLVAALRHEAA